MNRLTGLSFSDIPVVSLHDDLFDGHRVSVVRYDLCDPLAGGNKFFKLKGFLEKFAAGKYARIVSFGGAFSNHIAALAAVGAQLQIPTIGIIRGEEVSNITLDRARKQGMELYFVSRTLYREMRASSWQHPFTDSFADALIIPEGGNAPEGIAGAADMMDFIPADVTDIVLPAGTGATAAGIASRLKVGQTLHCINVAKNAPEIEKHFHSTQVQVHTSFTFGGYARGIEDLNRFIEWFIEKHRVPLEPVYSGKAMFALFSLMEKGFFRSGSHIYFLHTGGLQYQNS